ncbi:MAG: hypothetical protein ACRAVC_12025 [Trichormus sp.]
MGEGRVGTYGDLLKFGRRGDNLTPHHIPSNAFMKAKVPGYTTDQGFAIMMEHLSPGKGGRHRQTISYGKLPNLGLSPREVLAIEIRDVRSIYLCHYLYNKYIRESLRTLINIHNRILNDELACQVYDNLLHSVNTETPHFIYCLLEASIINHQKEQDNNLNELQIS